MNQKFSQIRNRQGERLDLAFHGGSHLGAIVVIGHGVTGNKDRPLLKAIANGLSAKGWPCIRFSFSGNGDSEGRFEESTISKELGDLAEVLGMVPQEKRVAYIGHSMGAAVGAITASKSMVVQSLISLAGMVDTAGFLEREFGDVVPGEGCMWDEPDCPLSQAFADDMKEIGSVLPKASEVMVPWLFIHGEDDDVVPIKDSQEAYEAARGEKKLIEIPDAGHLFSEENYQQIVNAIDAWLKRCFG